MTRIAHSFVVEMGDSTLEGLAHRSETARSRKRLKLHAVDIECFDPLHGTDGLTHALFDDFSIVEIFIDHAFG